MKEKHLTPLCFGFMATMLAFQPMIAYAAEYAPIVNYESTEIPKVDKVKYPQEFQDKIDVISGLLDKVEGVDDIYTSGMEDESFVESIQNILTLFVELNHEMDPIEVSLKHKENDQVDILIYRIRNILYELPKGIGHEMIEDFVRSIRDSYFEVPYSFFKDYIYFFYNTNEDSELTTMLLRFCYHVEEFDKLPPEMRDQWKPDETQAVLPPGDIDTGPSLPTPPLSPEDQMKEDLEDVWDKELGIPSDDGATDTKPNKSNSVKVTIEKKPVTRRKTIYEEVDGSCVMKKIKTVDGNESVEESIALPSNRSYMCGNMSTVDWSTQNLDSSTQTIDLEYNKNVLYYRMGEKTEWLKTMFRYPEQTIAYQDLISILRVVTTDVEGKFVDDTSKYLFVIDKQPIIIHEYEGVKTIEEVNALLSSISSIQLVIDPVEEVEEVEDDQEFVEEITDADEEVE